MSEIRPMNRPAVCVTGGAKRVGRSIVETFAAAGWHVAVHYNSSANAAEALAARLPSAQTISADLSQVESGRAMIDELAKDLTDWRCLINCASIFEPDDVTGLDENTNVQAININATVPVAMAQRYFEVARSEQGRRVVQVTDQKLYNLNPDFFSYTMSKAAADIAARMMAMVSNTRDRVYTLAPGAILPSHDQSAQEAQRSHLLNLLKRQTDAIEIAETALFMAEGPLTSGQNICVDSGQHLLQQARDVIYLEREGRKQ